jgi:hypothetical protein
VDCPPDGHDEGEPCGSDTNDGCNSEPPQFTDAACGQTICGTAWAEGGTRDTDWYLVSLPDPDGDGVEELRATLTSQFPGVCIIVSGPPDDCVNVVIEGTIGCSQDCTNVQEAVACLPAPADYVVFVATGDCTGGGIFDGFPCGGGNNDYVFEITCGPCQVPVNLPCGDFWAGPCCTPNDTPGCEDFSCCDAVCGVDPLCCDNTWDETCAQLAAQLCGCPDPADNCLWDCSGDNDDNVSVVDFLALLGQWDTVGSCDFDGSGVGITDFLQQLAHWGPCAQAQDCTWPQLNIRTPDEDLRNFVVPDCDNDVAPAIAARHVYWGGAGGISPPVGVTQDKSKVNVELKGGEPAACCKKCKVGFIQNVLSWDFTLTYEGGATIAGKFTTGPPLADAKEVASVPWYDIKSGPADGGWPERESSPLQGWEETDARSRHEDFRHLARVEVPKQGLRVQAPLEMEGRARLHDHQ